MISSALDLARVSGLAYGEPFACPAFETWCLGEAGSPLGQRGLELMTRLNKHLDRVKPVKVYIEAPMKPHIGARLGTNADTALHLNGLVFLAMTVCWARRIPTALHDRQKVLATFTARAKYKDQDDGKRACKARIRQIWRVDVNLDEADAGALLYHGCALDHQKGFMLARAAEPPMNRRVAT